MSKDPSPLLGYNNNIRHKNRVFHVQTEDSGVRHPHIITHLFMDGGRILKSVKTSYAEHLGAERMADLVRRMMKDQHKGMLIALRDGQFDVFIESGDPVKAGVVPVAASSESDVLANAPVEPGAAEEPEAPAAEEQADVLQLEGIDVAALERAAAETTTSPIFDPPRDMQPPPANLFRPRTGGNYSEIVDNEADRAPATDARTGRSAPPGARVPSSPALATGSSNRPGPLKRTSSPAPPAAGVPGSKPPRRSAPTPVAAAKTPESRYAPARPAAIFGQARPRGGNSIFGEDIISDKSLDEVILSYLAEDGDKPVREPSPKPASVRPADPKRRK